MKALRVNSPFGTYAVGTLITDATEVERVEETYPRRFYTPASLPDPHPAAAAAEHAPAKED